ncbi:MAG: hypothetical protein E2O39_15515 [Planctomycetota bacterium]|nr:MAG: hypothetical protein E2O39_15515 [Planctomycetota bacterium]
MADRPTQRRSFSATSHAYHRKERGGVESCRDTIPGVGPVRRKALLRRFGSVAGVKQASVEELAVIENAGAELARTIVAHLRDGE